jgi:hypothetical protein
MVAVDGATGAPVRVSGAALAGGPLLVLSPQRRLDDVARAAAGGGTFAGLVRRSAAANASAAPPSQFEALALAPRPEQLPARWGIPSFYGGAAFGPPYELPERTAEWTLSAETVFAFQPVDRQARMAQRVHPRGPALQSPGTFLAALYGMAPTPRHLGVGLDEVR